MSQNTARVSKVGLESNDENMLCVISNNNWQTHKSLGVKPDWFGLSKLCVSRCLKCR